MPLKLIIALGNPGVEYEDTRHNVGFFALAVFSTKHQISRKKEKKLLSLYGSGKIKIDQESYDLVLSWPTTFMNNSGEAVSKLLNWFKLESKDLIVVHDDVALNLGKIRISYDSGSAGHHGVESIIQSLGGIKTFTRLRIGIGPDPGGDIRKDYVLTKFSPSEGNLLKKVLDLSVEALETIITKNINEAMNKYNGIELGER